VEPPEAPSQVKVQSGNPAFLDKVYDGIRLEARIAGTEAPQDQRIENRTTLEQLVSGTAIAERGGRAR